MALQTLHDKTLAKDEIDLDDFNAVMGLNFIHELSHLRSVLGRDSHREKHISCLTSIGKLLTCAQAMKHILMISRIEHMAAIKLSISMGYLLGGTPIASYVM